MGPFKAIRNTTGGRSPIKARMGMPWVSPQRIPKAPPARHKVATNKATDTMPSGVTYKFDLSISSSSVGMPFAILREGFPKIIRATEVNLSKKESKGSSLGFLRDFFEVP